MKALVFSGPSLRDVFAPLDAERAAGFKPRLALVFQSPRHDPAALGQALSERGMAVVGATTAGEIVGPAVLEGECAVMALEIAPDGFATRLYTEKAGPTEEQARRLGRFATKRFADPVVFAFASGLETDGEAVVHGVRDGAGDAALPLFGGLAADDLKMDATHVFTAEERTANGLAGLVLDGSRYEARGIAVSGWQPVGVEKTVTHAEGNVVHTIDDVPALDLYKKYFDLEGRLDAHNGIVMDLGVQYPLSLQREDGGMVVRTPLMSVPDSASLVFAGSVPEGARVKFCIPPSFEIVEQVVEAAGGVRQDVPETDALMLISCKARHIALGPMIEDEVRGLYDLWKAPFLGYFAYGEIGPGKTGRCDFHNETCTLVALRALQQ